ncbi:MAG: hypothetical protein SFU21_00210 [Flavihumibacter sp.]|nr:hypothetical protein [Flavihumibacter sp.]
MKPSLLFACLLFAISIFSCKKQLSKESLKLSDEQLSAFNNPSNCTTNECLLYALLSGGGRSSALQCEPFTTPLLSNGMLHFINRKEHDFYLTALDSLSAKWDYDAYPDYFDTPNEINHLGDEAYNAVDSVLNFVSLRKKNRNLRI